MVNGGRARHNIAKKQRTAKNSNKFIEQRQRKEQKNDAKKQQEMSFPALYRSSSPIPTSPQHPQLCANQ